MINVILSQDLMYSFVMERLELLVHVGPRYRKAAVAGLLDVAGVQKLANEISCGIPFLTI